MHSARSLEVWNHIAIYNLKIFGNNYKCVEMITAKRVLAAVSCSTYQQLTFCSTARHFQGVTLEPKFTSEELQRILDILNESNCEQLSRFDVSQSRIKKLESWRNKKGPFKSLSDVLEVNGLGVKVLERLCCSIITTTTNNNNETTTTVKVTNGLKNRRQFVQPVLSCNEAETLSSAVGLHLAPAGISWAKLCRDRNQLDSWGVYGFSTNTKKMLPTDTFKLAMTIFSKIPIGTVYIFEAAPSISPTGVKQAAMMISYSQQQELTSMLLTLINTSSTHNKLQTVDVLGYTNAVYYLKANLSARLFGTLMGSERVSSMSTIAAVLEGAKNHKQFALPCTAVAIQQHLQDEYQSHTPVFQELLGQALLLAITFMDLCVYKNPASLAAVAQRR